MLGECLLDDGNDRALFECGSVLHSPEEFGMQPKGSLALAHLVAIVLALNAPSAGQYPTPRRRTLSGAAVPCRR
jgi:hypothetical protein